jgi:hypothetical protein
MISMCTFGKLVFAGKNNTKVAAKAFKTVLDHTCLKAIMSRFHQFNKRGGAFVCMQDEIVHFERACIVGIYADLPAAMKLMLTGSSCNTCFLPKNRMAEFDATAPLRTWANMAERKSAFLERMIAGESTTSVVTDAKKIGVNLYVQSAFSIPSSGINPIGPCPNLDNPWNCTPPVYLHGMEMGTLMKSCEGTMFFIIEKSALHNIDAAKACRAVDTFCAKVYAAQCRNSNVELGAMALLPQPHGITSYILTGKALDGHKRSSLARLLHMYIATCDLFSDHERTQHCKMYELLWECREQMSWPLHRDDLPDVQERMNQMDKNLIRYMLPFSKSKCQTEKHHQWAHYCHHRLNTGCAAKEYAFERSYAVGHKKQVSFTNKSSKTKAVQTSAKHYFRTGVRRLAVHLGLLGSANDEILAYRTAYLENAEPVAKFVWRVNERARRELRNKAATMDAPLSTASTTLRMTLKNRMTLPGKPGRLVPVMFRALHSAKNPWVDNIRVHYIDDENYPRVGFGKCLGFFGDTAGNFHVAMQWYKICGRLPIDRIGRMTKVELTELYDYVPVGSILNGALMVPLAIEPLIGYPQQWWVIQSHREGVTLVRLNT